MKSTTKTSKTSDSPPNNNLININPNSASSMFYEPTSVLDPHLTSSPAAAAPHLHSSSTLPPPSDDWDPLSFFLSSSTNDSSPFDPFDLPDLDAATALSDPPPPPSLMLPSSSVFDRNHLDLLLRAATAVEANDIATAHVILSRLNHINFGSNPLQRAAFHFKDALLSLLPIPDPPTPSPPISPLEIVNRITAHKSFSDLSPVPQFTSFTANQTILESLLLDSIHTIGSQSLHIIDFDIGLGGQWSSFVQEIATRSKSLRSPPPQIRITAIVPDETVETVLAADNLKDFARGIGIRLFVSFIHVGNLGTLALSRVPINSGEAVGVVLTPTIFRLIGGSPESSSALLRFIRQVSPRILVFVDAECFGNSQSFHRIFASGLEFYSSSLESVDAEAAATREEDVAVRRVEQAVIRPRIFGAVAG